MADVPKTARVRSVLEDPSSQAIARVYSNAYLNAAAGRAEEATEELVSFVEEVLGQNAEFSRLLSSRLMNYDERLGLIERVVKPRATEFFTNFLRVLARHDRLELLPQIAAAVRDEQVRRSGRQRVQVSSSRPLDDAALDRIRQRLRSVFQIEPILEPLVDEKLIGGLVIRVGNTVYDGSLRSRLSQLAKRMQQRSLHEIQSGRDRFSPPEGD